MLRNVSSIQNYVLLARDGEIGRCKDFLFDDEKWAVRYMVADTGNWLPGRKVLVSPLWAERVDWAGEKLWVDLSTDNIKNSPEYDPTAQVNRDYERTLYDSYGRPVYWK
jgi:hypothetical protein